MYMFHQKVTRNVQFRIYSQMPNCVLCVNCNAFNIDLNVYFAYKHYDYF